MVQDFGLLLDRHRNGIFMRISCKIYLNTDHSQTENVWYHGAQSHVQRL
jgi:hypothetical protein